MLIERGLLLETRSTRVLVVADLHIGYEKELSTQGVHVPPQSRRLLQRLSKLREETRAEYLLLLGDVKHSISRAESEELREVREFLKKLREQVPVGIVVGNHDGGLSTVVPEGIEVYESRGLVVTTVSGQRILLLHGHAKPRSEDLESVSAVVMGHVHPYVVLRDFTYARVTEPVYLKVRLRGTDLGLQRDLVVLVLPAFNPIVGGTPLEKILEPEKEHRTPLLKREYLRKECVEVILVDGTYLGTLSEVLTLSQEYLDRVLLPCDELNPR